MTGQTVVEVEEKTAHIFVVNLSSSVGLVLSNHFAAILANELILLSASLQVYAPTGHIRRRQI